MYMNQPEGYDWTRSVSAFVIASDRGAGAAFCRRFVTSGLCHSFFDIIFVDKTFRVPFFGSILDPHMLKKITVNTHL